MSKLVSQVPTDVLAQVLQHLEMSELRSTVKLVCRRFCAEAESEMLWCLICQNSGVSRVIPSYGSSWRAFAKRLGLMSAETVPHASCGGWTSLVGYETKTSTNPTSLLQAPTVPFPAIAGTAGVDATTTPSEDKVLSLPWGRRILKHGNKEKVSSVGIVYVGGGVHANEASVTELVTLCANVESRVRPSKETNVDATPLNSPSFGTPLSSPGARSGDDLSDLDDESAPVVIPQPKIEYFDICPVLDDQTRFLALRLVDTDLPMALDQEELNVAARHIARLLEVMWSTCGNLVFVVNPALNGVAVRRWFDTVGSRLPEAFRNESIFCTQMNTPNVTIVSPTINVAGNVGGNSLLPYQFRSWLGYRSNTVNYVSKMSTCIDEILPIPKPYCIPGWISPLVNPGLTPAILIDMVRSAAVGHPRVDLWSVPAMQRVLQGSSQHTLDFYTKAMTTEIQDRTKGETIPLENEEMVVTHRHFFFSALRSYNMQLSAICGQDVAAGTQLVETVKRDTNTVFRELWRANNQSCKQVCGTLFQHIFASATSQEVYQCSKFNSKNGLKYWLSVIHEKMDVYLSIAKGPRRFEVMSEKLSTEVIPEMMSWAASHPDHPYIHPEAVVLASKELRAKGDKMLMEFRKSQDDILGKMQRETAVYTTMTGNEWTASCHSDNAHVMIQRRPVAEAWEERMLRREIDLKLGEYQPGFDPADAQQPLPLLRTDEIHSEMAAEGEARAVAARTGAVNDLASTIKDVRVVSHPQRGSIFGALRRRLSNN